MSDTPTTLASQALAIVAAAFAEARAKSYRPMAVVVVDAGAQLLASAREDGATTLRLDIALGKAAAAIGMGANTRVLAKRSNDMPVFYGSVAAAAEQKFVPQTGAVLVTDGTGRVLGAVGASGGTGDEDEAIVIAGIAQAGFSHS